MSHKWLLAQRQVFFDAVYSRMWNWVRLPIRNPIFPQSPRLPLYKEKLRILTKLRKNESKTKEFILFLPRRSKFDDSQCYEIFFLRVLWQSDKVFPRPLARLWQSDKVFPRPLAAFWQSDKVFPRPLATVCGDHKVFPRPLAAVCGDHKVFPRPLATVCGAPQSLPATPGDVLWLTTKKLLGRKRWYGLGGNDGEKMEKPWYFLKNNNYSVFLLFFIL